MCCHGGLGQIIFQPGVVYTREANGILTGDWWRIVVELNVTEMEDEVLQLQQSTRELQSRLVGLAAKRGYLGSGLEELARIEGLVDEMGAAVRSLAGMLPYESPLQRAGSKKRGFLDILKKN